ncbi:hypothetical protein CSOJ01_14465 [Colletotrichum sojae]|uniref:Uncharacterized protein n=1 Tax=Colletotrichum sojae TaxID=2175907 RepID=A0A8H6IQK9_9PEZI|nr:hypothetical protein CSOJ01_14465 [Colletotrichum sojae]
MRFSATVVIMTALFLGVDAGAIRRQNEYVGDFRIWSEQGCGTSGNRGMWAITEGLTETCQSSFRAPDDIKAVYLNNMAEGCKLTLYSSPDCSDGARDVVLETCQELDNVDASFLSFKVTCA